MSDWSLSTSRPLYGLLVFTALFHLAANTILPISDLWRNSLHLGLLGASGFMLYPLRRGNPSLSPGGWCRWLAQLTPALLILGSSLYLLLFENALHDRAEIPLWHDLLAAGVAVLLTLELNRRCTGWVIPLLGLLFAGYVLGLGRYCEGVLYFRGFTLTRFLYRMYFTDEGLFGTIASISSTYVFMFVLFAAFLNRSGGSDFVLTLARQSMRGVKGGPGLVAVLASGLMGTISGSAIANTVSTGSITIPLMKRAGFRPAFAAGIETAASTGGQLMPPIMGAGAFLMAEYTGLPYAEIVAVSVLPALLYFASVAFSVYQYAQRQDLPEMESEEKPTSWQDLWREGLPFLLSFSSLVGWLVAGFTPVFAAGVSILTAVASSWLTRHHRMDGGAILEALAQGTRNMVVTGLLLVAAGLLIGCLAMSGLSISFSQLLLSGAGESLPLLLLLLALASLVLGMGLPVTAAYLMLAILAAPALAALGVPLLSAHMIIFWLSQDSNVTPPLCLAAFAAAGIAGASPMRSGVQAWRIAKGLYLLPLLFAYSPLLTGGWLDRLHTAGVALLGLYALSAALTGYLWGHLRHGVGRGLCLGAGVLLLWPDWPWQVGGFALLLTLGWVSSRPWRVT